MGGLDSDVGEKDAWDRKDRKDLKFILKFLGDGRHLALVGNLLY